MAGGRRFKKIKDAVIICIHNKQNTNGNQQQETRSIYSSFNLPLRTIEDMEEAVEQFLQIQEHFNRSVIFMLCVK